MTDDEQHGDHEVSRLLDGDDAQAEVTSAQEDGEPEPLTRQRSRTQLFSWHDVDGIVRFVQMYQGGSDEQRRTFREAFGWADDSSPDVLDVAQDLYPSGGSVEGYRTFAALATKLATGSLSFSDGGRMTADLARADVAVVKSFVRVCNVFGSAEVRHRRNMPIPDLLDGVISSLSGEAEGLAESVRWCDELLSHWPGDRT